MGNAWKHNPKWKTKQNKTKQNRWHFGTKNSAPKKINQTQEWQGSVPTKVIQIFNSNLYWLVYKSPLHYNAMCFHGYMLWLTCNVKVYLSQSTLKVKLIPVSHTRNFNNFQESQMKHYSLSNTREALTGKMCHWESFQCFNGYALINW